MKSDKRKYDYVISNYYKDILGETFTNTQGFEYEVQCYGYQKAGTVYYQIKFPINGYITFSTRDTIKKGTISNPYSESKMGEFSYGEVDRDAVNFMKLRRKWDDIIERCYNPKSQGWNKAGAKGMRLDPRWHVLEYFIADVTSFRTYHPALVRDGLVHIDKDYYQRNIKDTSKLRYGKETCQWLWHTFNTAFVKRLPPTFRITSPTGAKIYEGRELDRYAIRVGVKKFELRNAFKRAKALKTKNWVMIGNWKLEALKNKNGQDVN